eukprot:Skav208096  [mRNA]  locus=scaffold1681:159993:162113:- [translate_table: standard]
MEVRCQGEYFLRCEDGTMTEQNSSCVPACNSAASGHINVTDSTCKRGSTSCEAGKISSNNASLSHNKIDDLDQIVLKCPDGYSGSLDVTCRNGKVSIVGSSACHKICSAGTATIDGVEVEHGQFKHGDEVEVICPEGYQGQGYFLGCLLPTAQPSRCAGNKTEMFPQFVEARPDGHSHHLHAELISGIRRLGERVE